MPVIFKRLSGFCLALLLSLVMLLPDSRAATVLGNIHGVNYYPRLSPWSLFWPRFELKVCEADFTRIQALGFNTIRIFVPFQTFGGAAVDPLMKRRLHLLLNLAAAHKLRVIITLFDFYTDYAHPQPALRHLLQLTAGLGHDPAILAWDLKNESDSDYARYGKATVLEWIRQMAAGLRANGVSQPLTASTSQPEAAADAADALDYLTFHYYGPETDFEPRVMALRKRTNKALILGEYGFHTWAQGPDPHPPAHQFNYFLAIQAGVLHQQLAGSLVWTLYDFPAELREAWVLHGPGVQQHLGLLDTAGQPKAGLAALQQGAWIRDARTRRAASLESRQLELLIRSGSNQTIILERREGGRVLSRHSWRAGPGVQSFAWPVTAAEISEVLALRQRYVLRAPDLRGLNGQKLPPERWLELRRL